MPIYLDIHKNVDASPEDVAAAHLSDLEAQEKHGVDYLRYWYNPDVGAIFCMVDAPDEKACDACHLDAHGMVADKIIEVDEDLVDAFLGQGADGGVGRMVMPGGEPDGAFRTVLFTDLVGSTELTQRLGDAEAMKSIRAHDAIVSREIEARGGRIVKHTGDGTMASFTSATAAIHTAIAIQRAFRAHNWRSPERALQLRIGISAGEPVDEGEDLFGATVQLARRVCDAAPEGGIWVSNVVCELCLGKAVEFEDLGASELKGFVEPVRMHRVVWS